MTQVSIRPWRYVSRVLILGLLAAFSALGLALAKNPNEREIKPGPNVQDPDEIYDRTTGEPKVDGKIWVLDFKFKPLRSIKVDIPGRGERVCWYLWYQVTNKTLQPHTFIPDFELVTQDTNMVYRDEILPRAQDAIIQLEDPTGLLKIRNSVTISAEPIPPARPQTEPRPITGVAIWTDPNEPLPRDDAKTRQEKEKRPKLTDSNVFSIYIAGLSNGWAETDPIGDDPRPVVRRKTLQLNFRRFGDGTLRRDEDIRYISHEWLYRASSLRIPKDEEAPKQPAPPPASGARVSPLPPVPASPTPR